VSYVDLVPMQLFINESSAHLTLDPGQADMTHVNQRGHELPVN